MIAPIPPKTLALAAKGLQREVDKMNAVVAKAQEIGFDRQLEKIIRRLARL